EGHRGHQGVPRAHRRRAQGGQGRDRPPARGRLRVLAAFRAGDDYAHTVTTSTTDTDHHQDRHLARSLGHGQMAMIAMGSALGTGLFLGSGEATGIAGPAVILPLPIGPLTAATAALAPGGLASRHPVRGGFGTLAARSLSPFWGYLSRWLYWIVTVCVTGAELVACAAYLAYWVPAIPIWAGILIFAAVIIAIN